jgi:hypothetical protein
LVIHQAATDVVLGFIGRASWHPPDDDSDAIAGVAGWAFSLHSAKLLKVTDILRKTGGKNSKGISHSNSCTSCETRLPRPT